MIVASLLWLWLVEGQRSDKFDAIGSIIYIVAVVVEIGSCYTFGLGYD